MSLLADTQFFVASRMEQIVSCFKPGVKITVLVRSPDHPEFDFMMTDDTEGEIIAMVKRRQAAGADKGIGQPGGAS